MASLHRHIVTIGILALLTPFAGAQVGPGSQLTCSTNVTVTPALRGEGYTEGTGDITITCTGGSALTPGSQIPQVNFAIYYNTTVTSRLLPTAGFNNASEAVLTVDEPGSGLPGYGPSLPQMLCTNPGTGCVAYVGAVAGSTFNTAVSSGSTPAPNMYQGIVSGNSVVFFGVPVLPPTTIGSRVFRIANVRVNAQSLAGGSTIVGYPVYAGILISGAASLAVQNSSPTVGYISNGLTATASTAANLSQCSSQTKTAVSTLTFSENFGTAFKTRVQAQSNTLYAGQINNPVQNIPGAIYNSESGFVFPIDGSQTAGLADFGTRLKATFNNVPAGTRVFVSTANVYNSASPASAPNPVGGSAGNSFGSPNPYAVLVSSESISDGNAAVGGVFPAVASTDFGPLNGAVPIAEVAIINGSGNAVWEVVNTNPNAIESLKFAVYVTYASTAPNPNPAPNSTTTVTLGFAASASSGVAADAASPLPRFSFASNPARPAFTIQPCTPCASLIQPYSSPSLPPNETSSNLVNVFANPGCAWTAAANSPWLSVTLGSNGSGDGSVQFAVQANPTNLVRSSSLTIAGQTMLVSQRPPGVQVSNVANNSFVPELTVSPGELITVNAPVQFGPIAFQTWAATPGQQQPDNLGGARVLFNGTPARLLTVSETSATAVVPQSVGGTSTVVEVEYLGAKVDYAQLAVAAVTPGVHSPAPPSLYLLLPAGMNYATDPVLPGMSVAAILTGAGLTTPLGPDGQVYSATDTLPAMVQPVSIFVGGIPAQVLSATLAPTGHSPWPAGAFEVRFIVPPGTPSGSSVPFQASIGGNTVQAARNMIVSSTSCLFTLNQYSRPATASGGADSVNITTSPGCYWTASSNVNWLTLTSAATGADSGAVSFTVAASNSLQPRSGTITIAGMTLTINQAAATPVACAAAPAGIVWYQSVDYISPPNTATDMLLVGNMPMDKYWLLRNSLALPSLPDQRFCSQIPIAPGYLADAYVPTAAQRVGDFSQFSNLLLDPLTAHQVNGNTVMDPFPGGIIPLNRLPFPMAWRIGSYTTCTVSVGLTGDSSTILGAAANRSVTVTADNSTCGWAATTPAAWITFPSGNTGLGSQSLSYSVAANASAAARSADITVAGHTFTVTQQGTLALAITKAHTGSFTREQTGATYTVTVSNLSGTLPTSGTVTVTETVPTGMTLTGMAGSNWTCVANSCTRSDALAAASSYPPITVTVNVAANANSPLINAVSVSGGGASPANTTDPATLSCTYQLSGTAAFGGSAAASSVAISSLSGCAWTASTATSWLHITSGAAGTGNGQVNFTIDANLSTSQRFGTFTIAGQSFIIIQGGSINPAGAGLRFVPLAPCRIADTRDPNGPFGGPPLAAGVARDFNLPASFCGIPANAQAYSLNLTVVPLGPLGFLSVWPAGQYQPAVSTLNSGDGRVKANAAIVPAGVNGAVTLYATDPTHVIIDINGYFVPANGNNNLAFYPLTPCRIADTRNAAGVFGAPALAANAARSFPLLSSGCAIPASAQAYALNMTVVPAVPLGFLSAWPTGLSQPGVSTLNAPTRAVTANAAIVPAGTGGAITLLASNPTDVIIDINGYFAPPGAGGMQFYAATPCRILDTREAAGPFGGPLLGATIRRDFVITASACGIPANAGAYSLNATVVPLAPLGFLSMWGGGGQPAVSTLNAGDGSVVANAALVPASGTGSVAAYASSATHLILDINGYFAQ